jgi:hypothetical protein
MSSETQNAPHPIQEKVMRSTAPFWLAPWEFAVHALVGTSIFAIIAAAAVALELAVHKLQTYGIGNVIIFGLKAAEYTVFGVDLFLFGVFLWRTAKRTIKNL